MAGHLRQTVKDIIIQCKNKPDQETWMKVVQSFNKLETELDEWTKKYPEQAKLRKVPDNLQGAKTVTKEDENINTVMNYMKEVQRYRPDLKINTEQLIRESSDMVDCLLYFRSIDTKTVQSKDNSFSITLPGSTSATGETSKNQNQQPTAGSKGIRMLEDKIKTMEKGEKNLNEKLNLLENRVKSLEEKNRTGKDLNQKLESRLSEFEHYLQHQNQDLEACKTHNDNLHFSLSSFASKQLSEQNRNVADLSDQNRPIKIGEKFGSLFDDEWSEAYDALSNNEDRSEEDIIQYLIKFIQESYKFCERTAKMQLETLNEKMKTVMTNLQYKDSNRETHEINCAEAGNNGFDSARAKYARDYRKAAAAESLVGVKKMFKETKLKEELEKFSGEEKDAIISYIDRCTELIWFMVVQDPPMVLDIPEPGRPFNDHAFKYYKTKGKFVKLAVWPAVKLCDNGGLISKGYALPK